MLLLKIFVYVIISRLLKKGGFFMNLLEEVRELNKELKNNENDCNLLERFNYLCYEVCEKYKWRYKALKSHYIGDSVDKLRKHAKAYLVSNLHISEDEIETYILFRGLDVYNM